MSQFWEGGEKKPHVFSKVWFLHFLLVLEENSSGLAKRYRENGIGGFDCADFQLLSKPGASSWTSLLDWDLSHRNFATHLPSDLSVSRRKSLDKPVRRSHLLNNWNYSIIWSKAHPQRIYSTTRCSSSPLWQTACEQPFSAQHGAILPSLCSLPSIIHLEFAAFFFFFPKLPFKLLM